MIHPFKIAIRIMSDEDIHALIPFMEKHFPNCNVIGRWELISVFIDEVWYIDYDGNLKCDNMNADTFLDRHPDYTVFEGVPKKRELYELKKFFKTPLGQRTRLEELEDFIKVVYASLCTYGYHPIIDALYTKLITRKRINTVTSEENKRPKVVCFCGSTRFAQAFMVERWKLDKAGIITLGINILPPGYFKNGDSHGAEQENVKSVLNELHKRKIDISDEVMVLNVGGYIGESTRNEIEYAKEKGKPVKYLENDGELQS